MMKSKFCYRNATTKVRYLSMYYSSNVNIKVKWYRKIRTKIRRTLWCCSCMFLNLFHYRNVSATMYKALILSSGKFKINLLCQIKFFSVIWYIENPKLSMTKILNEYSRKSNFLTILPRNLKIYNKNL